MKKTNSLMVVLILAASLSFAQGVGLGDIKKWHLLRDADTSVTVPVFEIDLVYFNAATTNFVIGTEIELKASTNNNFTTYTNGWGYWGDTLHTNLSGYSTFTNADYGMTVYYADYTNSDSRVHKKFVTDGTQGMLTDKIGTKGYVSKVLVIPSPSNHVGQAYSWMAESNTNVLWCWRPRGASNAGPSNLVNQALWYPCRPVEWRKVKLNVN